MAAQAHLQTHHALPPMSSARLMAVQRPNTRPVRSRSHRFGRTWLPASLVDLAHSASRPFDVCS
jgi:hypothetical protein